MARRFAIPVAGALAFVLIHAVLYSAHAAISIRSDTQLKDLASGFHSVENVNGSNYAWTDD